jgi:anaerobic selenocysteine-containing dehydrogenase
MNSDDHDVIYRDCTLCEAHCGVQITVDRSSASIVDIRGDKDDPFSQGYICPKSTGLEGLSTDPDRVRHPLRKQGDDFVEISWEEAFETVTERLGDIRTRHGANAIATYLGNPNAHDYGSNLSIPTLVRALGTKWRFSATSVDQLPKMFANQLLFGSPGSFAVPDLDRTEYLLILGANPVVSNGSIMTAPGMRGRLRQLRERGGSFVVVDPRRTESAALANLHVPIQPGTDALFLFGLLHTMFNEDLVHPDQLEDRISGQNSVRDMARPFSPEAVASATGIPAETTRKIARDFAAAPKAACYGRIGVCTQEFGTLSSWLIDVINILTGNLDRIGGVMFPHPAHAHAGPARRTGRMPYDRWRTRVRGLPEFAGELPVSALAEEIDTPGEDRVRALFTVAGNPVSSTPNARRLDRAFAQLEFMVSVDLYINETTRHADIILPTSAPLERTNYPLAFHNLSVRNFAKWAPAVLEPPPGVKHLYEIVCEISGRLGGADAQTADEMMRGAYLSRVAGPGSANPEVSLEEAQRQLGEKPGLDWILDGMIRAGSRGDRFSGEGLSLEKIQKATHGLDLGPMTPRLEEQIATEDARIQLDNDLMREDTERLAKVLDREPPELVLIGRRHIRSNNSWMHNLEKLAKGPSRCTLLINPDDAKSRGLTNGQVAEITSAAGAVNAEVEVSDEVRIGVVSLPHGYGTPTTRSHMTVAGQMQPGPNSNDLTDENAIDKPSGNAILNGIPVRIQAVADLRPHL